MTNMIRFLIFNFMAFNFFWTSTSHAFRADDLVGRWQQDCQSAKLKTEDFTSTQDVALTENYFSKANCENLVLSVISKGQYVLNEEKIDFTFEAVVIRIASSALVEKYNARGTCGIKTWATNQDYDVTGLQCDLFGFGKNFQIPKKGEVRYGIYSIYEDLLFFGALSKQYDATTPEKRPIYLENRGYKKVKPSTLNI